MYRLLLIFFCTALFAQEKPLVILLNGTSSAGKTSIAKEIQAQFEKPILHVGIDHYFGMLPESYYLDGERAAEGFNFVHRPGPLVFVEEGPVARQLTKAMHHSIKALAKGGFNLVLDEVLVLEEDYRDYLELLKDCRLFVVGVTLPLKEAEVREIARGDRYPGQARAIYDVVHVGKQYDLVIDSSLHTSRESARLILQAIQEKN